MKMRSKPGTRAPLPVRFPIKLEQPLLSATRREFQSDLRGLQYPAQEYVCQIIRSYREGNSPKTKNSLDDNRKKLRLIGRRLASFIDMLPNENEMLAICEDIRSIHRPPGAPGSVREMFRVLGLGDYVNSHKEYFQRANLPDPAKPLDELIESVRDTQEFLTREIALIESKIKTLKSSSKLSPHLWWRGGGIYYMLERIYRESSIKPITQAEAHRKIIALMVKINRRRLRFDVEKAYCPAIRSAVDRMSAEYKKVCDQYLREWLGLSPKPR